MLKIIGSILFMIIIGAFIGGMTNSLAIKMLFRPHEPIYVRGKRLPFTPGLIPKRREELAVQLGNMVVDHLITPESIQTKLLSAEFKENMTKYSQDELKKLINSTATLNDHLSKIGIENFPEIVNKNLTSLIRITYKKLVTSNKTVQLKELIDKETAITIVTQLQQISSGLLNKAANYFATYDGKLMINELINDFFSRRSSRFSNMIHMFLEGLDFGEKIQPEVIHFLQKQSTVELVHQLIEAEFVDFLEMEWGELTAQIDEDKFVQRVAMFVNEQLNINSLANKRLKTIIGAYEHKIIDQFIPKLVSKTTKIISDNVPILMERLAIENIVRDQVESFPVARLEEMVLSISRREFKMITYLGGLLGGLIGLIQGIIVIFI